MHSIFLFLLFVGVVELQVPFKPNYGYGFGFPPPYNQPQIPQKPSNPPVDEKDKKLQQSNEVSSNDESTEMKKVLHDNKTENQRNKTENKYPPTPPNTPFEYSPQQNPPFNYPLLPTGNPFGYPPPGNLFGHPPPQSSAGSRFGYPQQPGGQLGYPYPPFGYPPPPSSYYPYYQYPYPWPRYY